MYFPENSQLDDLYTRYRQRLRKSLFKSGLGISFISCTLSIIFCCVGSQVRIIISLLGRFTFKCHDINFIIPFILLFLLFLLILFTEHISYHSAVGHMHHRTCRAGNFANNFYYEITSGCFIVCYIDNWRSYNSW